jgi:hypothetical protein
MGVVDGAGARRLRVVNASDRTGAHRLSTDSVTQPGGTEHRHVVTRGELEDRDRVAQGRGHGLVDEEGFSSQDDRYRLRQMRPAVDAQEHDRVDVSTEVLDGRKQFDAVFLREFGGEPFDTVAARIEIRASPLEGGYDPGAGDVIRIGGIVEDPGEGDGMGGVETDQTHAQIGSLRNDCAGQPQAENKSNSFHVGHCVISARPRPPRARLRCDARRRDRRRQRLGGPGGHTTRVRTRTSVPAGGAELLGNPGVTCRRVGSRCDRPRGIAESRSPVGNGCTPGSPRPLRRTGCECPRRRATWRDAARRRNGG